MPKEEKRKDVPDLSFYRPDKLGYSLTLLSVVAELTYLIMLFKYYGKILFGLESQFLQILYFYCYYLQ